MMVRSERNTSEYFSRDYITTAMVIFSLLKIINTLFSRVKISCLCTKARLVFHWCLYDKLNYSLYPTIESNNAIFQETITLAV